MSTRPKVETVAPQSASSYEASATSQGLPITRTWGLQSLRRVGWACRALGPRSKLGSTCASEGDQLLWLRDFSGTRLDTRMYLTDDGRMAERRGLMELCFRVAAVDS